MARARVWVRARARARARMRVGCSKAHRAHAIIHDNVPLLDSQDEEDLVKGIELGSR